MTTWVIFAPRRFVRRYLRQGWRVVGPCLMHHGVWSVLLTRYDEPPA